ncbi:ADP-ribosyltransferase exoenzyme [Pedobacter westerhofensis]|uniref:ADP-ribosyltransferase exoenzyme n=1 Tax=Pedobacter westerhofensis TaxID=425512 RepID=A0A521EHB3_9SPHI|nr:ADP-ribosyltransferase [Pedobacter westerhofensis]SMO83293.1 ADP-ribosyltransferase exoenzyme [Pedobacter westerhofensis]
MTKAEQFARKYLGREIHEIERSARKNELPDLSVYEKAIIYKYSEDGYEQVNELLRSTNGKTNSNFGTILNTCLSKLENFEGLVYRCASLNSFELKKYLDAEKDGEAIIEHSFISTTKSELTAISFGRNTRFVIYSKTGKEIEKIAKYGKFDPANEKEVLFKSGRKFTILEVIKEAGYTLITMEEI